MADSGTYDPETIARHQAIAATLLKQSTAPREIRSRLQGIGQLGEGLIAGLTARGADQEQKEARSEALAQALQAFGGQGGQQPTAVPAPMPAPVAAPQQTADNTVPIGTTQAADASLPRGLRNNNPLNIEEGAFTQGQPGFSGSDGRFAKFQTPEQGIGAANALLDSYGRRGLNTPAGIINRWAPSADGNNTPAYAMAIAKQLGIGPNDAIPPEMRPQLIAAMGQHENGRPIGDVAAALQAPPQAQGGPPPQQVAQNAPAPTAGAQGGGRAAAIAALLNPWTPPALASALGSQINPTYGFQTLPDGTIIRTDPKSGTVQPIYQAPTKNTFGKIGQNRDGQDIYGFINPEKGTATPVQGATGAQPGAADGVTGEDFLKGLNDPGRADLIKGMVEGRMAPAQMGRFGTQAVQSLLKDAARYEPGFDMTKWNARVGTAKDFTSGQAAKNVTSINTVIGHLGDLADKADALGNTSFPIANQVKNFASTNVGNPEIKNFDLARNAVADEMAKVFRGGGLSDAETRQWKENISAANSPEQLRGAINTAIGLMDSRLNALGEQRNKGMSTQTEPTALLTDKSRATLDKVKKWAGGEKPAEAAAAATTAPRAINPKTGEQIELRDGKWVSVK